MCYYKCSWSVGLALMSWCSWYQILTLVFCLHADAEHTAGGPKKKVKSHDLNKVAAGAVLLFGAIICLYQLWFLRKSKNPRCWQLLSRYLSHCCCAYYYLGTGCHWLFKIKPSCNFGTCHSLVLGAHLPHPSISLVHMYYLRNPSNPSLWWVIIFSFTVSCHITN